jgi:hypothetical protein
MRWRDVGMVDSTAFKLLPHWLILANAYKPMPAGHPIARIGDTAMNDAMMFVTGGLHLYAKHRVPQDEVIATSPESQTWRLQCSSSDQSRLNFDIHGVFDLDSCTGTVSSLTCTSANAGVTWTISGWRDHNLNPGLRIAEKIVRTVNQQTSSGVFVLNSVMRISPSDISAALQLPALRQADTTRPAFTITEVIDFRPEPPRLFRLDASNQVVEDFPPEYKAERTQAIVRRVGFSVASATVLFLVALRLLLLRSR